MGRPTELVSKLRALESEIDSWAESQRGRSRRCAALYRELWGVLAAGDTFQEIPDCSRTARSLCKQLDGLLRKKGHALGKALIEYTVFGTSAAAVRRTWRVGASEWAYLMELATWVGERVRRGAERRKWPPEWFSEVEQRHECITAEVSRQALEDMLLGAYEAYWVPKGPGGRYTEVYGECFGSVRTARQRSRGLGRHSDVSVSVRRVALHLRARATAGSVEPDPRSEGAHLEIASALFPHDDVVGDFHSHPYDTLGKLRTARGWEYSPPDEAVNREWLAAMRQAGHRPRVGLILAVARVGRRGKPGEAPAQNVLRTQIGDCHAYLAAYRINRDGSYSDTNIQLRCAAITGLGG